MERDREARRRPRIVQGVAFRWYAKERARELGLAAGSGTSPTAASKRASRRSERRRSFVEWLRHGPPAARVDGVELEEDAPSGAERFEVRR
jgi:acylphosphatase